MNFIIEDKGRYTLVTSKAEKLDTTSAPELKSELVYLNKTGVRNAIIDLSATRYCDSSGLSALLVANRLCKSVGGSLVVCGLQEPVQKLVQISQLESVLSITPTVAEAVDLLYMEEIEKDVNTFLNRTQTHAEALYPSDSPGRRIERARAAMHPQSALPRQHLRSMARYD